MTDEWCAFDDLQRYAWNHGRVLWRNDEWVLVETTVQHSRQSEPRLFRRKRILFFTDEDMARKVGIDIGVARSVAITSVNTVYDRAEARVKEILAAAPKVGEGFP